MRTRLLAATMALALLAAACGGDEAGDASADTGPVDDNELLDFRAQSIDGSTVDVDSLTGTDLVIWFWAPW